MSVCFGTGRSCAARFTRVNACGDPVTGTSGFISTKGFVSVQYTPNIVEGDTIELKNACGEVDYSDKARNQIQWWDLVITLTKVDPDLINMLTAYPLDVDALGNNVGFQATSEVTSTTGFAIETWTEVASGVCVPGAEGKWGYFLAPLVVEGTLQEFTIQNDAVSLVINARAKSGSSWANGPATYLVDPDENGDAVVLNTPIGATSFLDVHYTTIAPPSTATCGFQTLAA